MNVWEKLHNMLTCDLLWMFTCKSIQWVSFVVNQEYEVTKPVLTIIVHFLSFDLFVDIFIISFSSNPGCPFTMKFSVLPDSKFRA